MKQLKVTEKQIGENTFYIRPFGAFVAANISGDLAAILVPIIGSIVGNVDVGDTENFDIQNIDISSAMPALSSSLTSLSGAAFEGMMKKLLINHQNVSVEGPEIDGHCILDYDLANEIFCGDLQDMLTLCIEVIKINFNGFFKKLVARFGNRPSEATETKKQKSTESST